MLQIIGDHVEKRGSSVTEIKIVLIQLQHKLQIKGCEERGRNQQLLCSPKIQYSTKLNEQQRVPVPPPTPPTPKSGIKNKDNTKI
jgi:hypothetical protein